MAAVARVSFQQTMQVQQRACFNCGTTKTPQWREGPEGPKTLCNACGVKRNRQLNKQLQQKLAERKQQEEEALRRQQQPKTPLSSVVHERNQEDSAGAAKTSAAVSSVVAAAAAAANAAAKAVSPAGTNGAGPPRVRRQSAQRSMDALATFINSGGVGGGATRRRDELKDSGEMPPPQRVRRNSETGSDTDIDELRPPSPPATTSPAKLAGARITSCEACVGALTNSNETLDAATLLAMRHAPAAKGNDARFATKSLSKMSQKELEKVALTAANEAVAAEAAVNAVAKVLAHKQALMIRSVENHKAAVIALHMAKKRSKNGTKDRSLVGGGGG